MEKQIKFTASILESVVKQLTSLPEKDQEAIVGGKASIRIVVEHLVAKRESGAAQSNSADFSSLIESLSDCQTRESVDEKITDAKLSKSSLQSLTRALGLPVNKDDNIARLRERIVESVIGFRLRSRAIQGDNSSEEEADGK